MMGPFPFRVVPNPRAGTPGTVVLPASGFRRAKAEITSWPDYAPTPLRDLPDVARDARVASVRLKDESGRFGLGSFKALGGGYAVATLLTAELARRGVAEAASSAELQTRRYESATRTITVACATAGNHGRGVAWAARRFRCRAVVFLPAGVSEARAAGIAAEGAEIRRVSGIYDDALREADRAATAEGWLLVSDTSWPGYTETPREVMQGYRLMPDEALGQWSGEPPTHVFIQGGVGGIAAAVSVEMRARLPVLPALIVVEPDRAACLLASAELGARTAIPGELDTVMGGLACSEPSLLAWHELERGASAFVAVPDQAALAAMALLASHGILSEPSGAAGLAALLLAACDPASREMLEIGGKSRVLLFNTEGRAWPDACGSRTADRPMSDGSQ
jgi:diaminopropionate ammonia-lyase